MSPLSRSTRRLWPPQTNVKSSSFAITPSLTCLSSQLPELQVETQLWNSDMGDGSACQRSFIHVGFHRQEETPPAAKQHRQEDAELLVVNCSQHLLIDTWHRA